MPAVLIDNLLHYEVVKGIRFEVQIDSYCQISCFFGYAVEDFPPDVETQPLLLFEQRHIDVLLLRGFDRFLELIRPRNILQIVDHSQRRELTESLDFSLQNDKQIFVQIDPLSN